jgi:glycosyltransferase involved in cell wall biosynthesis
LRGPDIKRILTSADVLLFVRGHLSSRRSSAIAAIACGLPIVGYAGEETGFPITEAGVSLVPEGDREALADALWRVLTDPELWENLHQRNLAAQRDYFAWDRVADRFLEILG